MKLPEIDEHFETCIAEQATPVEIAQLHCLRSIAVSLESLVGVIGLQDKGLDAKTFKRIVAMLAYHSVADTLDDKEEK